LLFLFIVFIYGTIDPIKIGCEITFFINTEYMSGFVR
jgi:hypothetical protein